MFKKLLLCLFCFSLFSSTAFAEEEAAEGAAPTVDYQYYPLEPDIITNYIKPGQRIGYVRVSIELMVKSSADYAKVEAHDQLIRDRIITIFGEYTEAQIKSIADREVIRTRCLNQINEELFTMLGSRPIADLHFTKYLYQ